LDARRAGVFGGTAAAVAIVPCLLFQWTSGGAFWDNIGPDNPTPTSLQFGTELFRELLVTQGIPALLAVAYVVATRAWKHRVPRLLVLYWVLTAIAIVGITKAGANRNYWIEFAAANAILASLAIWTCLTPRRRLLPAFASMLPVLLLGLQLGVLAPARFVDPRRFDVIPLSWLLTQDAFAKLSFRSSGFNNLVRAVGTERGELLAESLDVAVLSGHPVAFEPFAYSMLEEQGRWNSDALVDDVCSGRVSLLVLSYPIESNASPVGIDAFPMWPNSVMAALRNAMKLSDERDWHWLYRPVTDINSRTIASCEAAAAAARST
jgi:hypothetical protein